ncbi:NADPH:quinone reductase-like Zn-dependent oxidoreductase [Actinoplanes octamycinicus]|uniref:NADPH:quinone reductase-like Zn-dependent oxidoreductase n=1 Tax=Actinoplanes octamycinicus TaxID=135948 RepID=A0A7W7M7T9_9ACTN|nr:NAD(P)-dependent alcohol dehydrogenase [Actinoplanes octamycinicus]MBB4740086.1 NADPH:quinone reductase-like Zn-dependent oxidoreductase [Actinoplanes octamycinicus]GIE59482.1 NADPH:quinone reductase [Actinoplanes octamycinicus]
MRAIVQDRYGGPEQLRWTEVATPEPGDGEVLIRTRAASLNAWDWHFMRGDPYVMRLPRHLTRPGVSIRGRDVAGEIAAVGPGVTGFRVGEAVFADLGPLQATFAEFVRAPQELVAPKPANLSFAEAAALPLAAGAALGCLRESGLTEGQHLLINGASGGVGTFAVQIAKSIGAEVTAVCSTRNVELVGKLGADHVIDYRREDFVATGDRFDVVLDLVGNRSLPDLRSKGGVLVLSGGGTSTGGSLLGPFPLVVRALLTARFVRQRILLPAPPPGRATLDALRDLTGSGRVTPVIDRSYPLAEAADAMRYLETGHARAKVVLTV